MDLEDKSKSERRRLEEAVIERLPWWKRELLHMRDRVQAKAEDKDPGKEKG